MKGDPTPVPDEIKDRVSYQFSVSIEGAPHTGIEDTAKEAEALAAKVRGELARWAPDRWSSVQVGCLPHRSVPQL